MEKRSARATSGTTPEWEWKKRKYKSNEQKGQTRQIQRLRVQTRKLDVPVDFRLYSYTGLILAT